MEGNMAQFDTTVIRSVRAAARRSHTAQRGFVDFDDLVQEGYSYVYGNREKVERWFTEGDTALIQHAVYQHLHRFTMRQRYLKDGTRPEDYYVYQLPVIAELLPDVFNEDPVYGTSSSDLNTVVKSGKSPAEGGDRMAMIADIKFAIGGLSNDDRGLLWLKYSGKGMTDNEVAQFLEQPEVTVNKRLRSVMRRIARRLGSEPVKRRKAMSNAQAQHVTREQE